MLESTELSSRIHFAADKAACIFPRPRTCALHCGRRRHASECIATEAVGQYAEAAMGHFGSEFCAGQIPSDKTTHRPPATGTACTAPGAPVMPVPMQLLQTSASSPPAGAVARPVSTVRSWELPAWKTLGNAQRVAVIGKIAREGALDPRIRRAAVRIFRESGVAPRDYLGQQRAILKAVQQKCYFNNEKGEILTDALWSLDLQPDGSIGPLAQGDCDCLAVATVALLESTGLHTALVTSGRDRSGRSVRWVEGTGPSPAGVAWSHLYLACGPHPFRATKYNARSWRFLDPSTDAPLGWDCVDGGGVSDPQLGDAGPPSVRPSGIPLKTALHLIGISVVSAVILGRLRKSGWI